MNHREIATDALQIIETDAWQARFDPEEIDALEKASCGEPFDLALLRRVVARLAYLSNAEADALEREAKSRFGK